MPTCGAGQYESLSQHYRYFERLCRTKGASEHKAREWAMRQVRRGRRIPSTEQ